MEAWREDRDAAKATTDISVPAEDERLYRKTSPVHARLMWSAGMWSDDQMIGWLKVRSTDVDDARARELLTFMRERDASDG